MHTNQPSQAASIPEGQNALKRNQLRELAALNGTLRDDENQACQNCKLLFPSPHPFMISNSQKVAKLDIASTTAPSSATLLPTSSVVSVATRATWLVTVPTVSEAATGAMAVATVVATVRVPLVQLMLWIVRWRCVFFPLMIIDIGH